MERMEWALLSSAMVAISLMVSSPLEANASSGELFPWSEAGEGICASALTPHGYTCQEVDVTTRDGYILSVQRIGGRGGNGGNGTKGDPVVIVHGVVVDGMIWLTNNPEQNLPTILADEGFDVWMVNTRGTRFSRRHKSLNPTQSAYWNWSWDELVAYEFPAVFDYVYGQTGRRAHFIGHSEATLVALAALSEGKLVDKMKSAALLSPIAYLSHIKNPQAEFLARPYLGELAIRYGISEFNPRAADVIDLLRAFCRAKGLDCYDLFILITGNNCCLNASTVDSFLKSEPQPTSAKNIVHLIQLVRNRVIAKYDYLRSDFNLVHYGQPYPPTYNLSNVPHQFPIYMSYGGEDFLSDDEDVALLLDVLKDHDADRIGVQYVKNYAHADFVMAVNAKDIVYNQVVGFFKNQG